MRQQILKAAVLLALVAVGHAVTASQGAAEGGERVAAAVSAQGDASYASDFGDMADPIGQSIAQAARFVKAEEERHAREGVSVQEKWASLAQDEEDTEERDSAKEGEDEQENEDEQEDEEGEEGEGQDAEEKEDGDEQQEADEEDDEAGAGARKASRKEEALLEVPGAAAGTAPSPSIRREPPPRGSKDAASVDSQPPTGQVALINSDHTEHVAVDQEPSASDGDLSKKLMKDANNLANMVSWHVNWRVALSFTTAIVLGLVAGVIVGLATGALKGADSGAATTGGLLVVLAIVVLVSCVVPAICMVHDLLVNMELVAGQMVNFALGRLAVNGLTRMTQLETASNDFNTSLAWDLRLSNPSEDLLKLTHVEVRMSMNDTSMVLYEARAIDIDVPPKGEGKLPLVVDPSSNIRQNYKKLQRGTAWSTVFTTQVYDMAMEGEFRGKVFRMTGFATMPLRLADLPIPDRWPTGLDEPTVERAFTKGLEHLHSDSGELVSLPGSAKCILDYDSLSVGGPLRTWFTWIMIFCMSVALPGSCCLTCGALKIAGAGKGSAEEKTPLAASEAGGAAATPATESNAPATAQAPAAAPAAAPTPAPAARATRSRAPAAKAAAAPAAGADDDNEF